jgi:general secretion pathway protein J
VKRRSHGFTLVEMLVALAVAGLLVSLVYGAVRIGHRAAQAADVLVERNEIMRIGWRFLHDALSRARPVQDPERREDLTGFRGEPDRLEFVADLPAYTGPGGLTRIALWRDAAGRDDRLLVSRRRHDASGEAASDEAIREAVLVERLDDVEIRYFGRLDDAETSRWHAAWDSERFLPNLVQIQVRPTAAPAWPVIIARPLTGTRLLERAFRDTGPDIDIPVRVPGDPTDID